MVTVVVCGAGPAVAVGELVTIAKERGWAVEVIATPSALAFLDVSVLEAQTGTLVRSEYRSPDRSGARSLPDASAIVVAPATFNTICKLASGVSDTYALGVLAEAIGRGVPVAVLPFVNSALAGRAPFRRAVESLREEGVRVVFGPGQWVPHPPGKGGERISAFPWSDVLDAAEVRVS
jgi:phosphopantothenoylcysteine synthetase/decarboxylase